MKIIKVLLLLSGLTISSMGLGANSPSISTEDFEWVAKVCAPGDSSNQPPKKRKKTQEKKRRISKWCMGEDGKKMKNALLDVQNGKSIKDAASDNNIPMRTLYRYQQDIKRPPKKKLRKNSRTGKNKEIMKKAILAVENGTSVQLAARMYKIAQSTLHKNLKKTASRKPQQKKKRVPKCQQCINEGEVRPWCKLCGGSKICQHRQIKSRCKECGGPSLCEHGCVKYRCIDCGGRSVCQHNRQKFSCKDCKSQCSHGITRYKCKKGCYTSLKQKREQAQKQREANGEAVASQPL